MYTKVYCECVGILLLCAQLRMIGALLPSGRMNRATSASIVCLLRALKRNQFDREKVVVAVRVQHASIE